MKEFKYVITDAEGIHARPATMLVKKAEGVLGVMGLGAKKGAEITVTVDGEDEEIAAAELETFLKENL